MSVSIKKVNDYVNGFAKVVNQQKIEKYSGNIKVGVDLGTANIALSVVTEDNHPLAGALYPASVIRDGIVVDYMQAVEIVKKLKRETENLLGMTLFNAATAVPPRSIEGNQKIMANVLDAAFFEVTEVLEETNAAASVLGIRNGAVVDVGGGTTGLSILKDGEIIYTADEATGGTHMSLVLAGSKKISFKEAEILKKDIPHEDEVFTIIRPVIDKMASIIKNHLKNFDDIKTIYVVGGASNFNGFTNVFQKHIGIKTLKPEHPLLITPLGIAISGGLN